MEALLNKLYSYDNFSLYLTIAIIVLVILFFIVLFFGKKDQKEREIEATKKLQLEGVDGFKQESEPVKVEVTPEEKVESDTIVVPEVDNTPAEEIKIEEPKDDTIIMPVINPEEMTLSNIEPEPIPISLVTEEEQKNEEPVLNIEPKLVDEDIKETPIFEKEIETPLVFAQEEVEVPDFNLDDILNTAEEVKVEEEKVEPKVEPKQEVFSSVFVSKKDDDEDLEMELPSLKKGEEKPEEIEKPVLNDYNLDELSGETYNINKE